MWRPGETERKSARPREIRLRAWPPSARGRPPNGVQVRLLLAFMVCKSDFLFAFMVCKSDFLFGLHGVNTEIFSAPYHSLVENRVPKATRPVRHGNS